MKKNGYDQFFKEAKKNAQAQSPVQSISAAKLRENMQQKKSKKPSRKFPIVQFAIFIFCGLGLFLAIENFDKIESTLQKVDIGLGLAQAESRPAEGAPPAAAAAANPAPAGEAAPAVAAGAVTPATSGAVRAETEDDSDYIYKLSERKKVLDAREEELNKKAAEIEAQKAVIEKKLTELEEYRTKISTMLQDRIKSDDGKVETLVQVYTNMKPGQAAKIFETMDEDLVIDILSRMKKKSAAEILNLIKTEKAQAFAERYAGYRVPTSIPKPAPEKDAPAAAEQPEPTKP